MVKISETLKTDTLYIPNKGDIVFLNFDSSLGHEQSGKRPALVLSDFSYNQRSGLVLVCPITSKIKGYPFEVALESNLVQGFVIADQIKSVDIFARKLEFKEKVGQKTLDNTLAKILALLKI